MKKELENKLSNMFVEYNYEDSKELLRSAFTTLVVVSEIEEREIIDTLSDLYDVAFISDLDINFDEFYSYMTDILIQI